MTTRIVLLVLVAGLLGGCSSAPTSDDGFTVVATTGMAGDFVRSIGGDSIRVETLMGPGVDPHLYKATQGDLARLQAADLIVCNGLHLEGKLGEVLDALGERRPVVAIADGIDPDRLLTDPADPDVIDPHIWFDVSLWASAIPHLADTLAALHPASATEIHSHAAAYSDTLQALHDEVRRAIASIPDHHRVLVTAHDAFHYFGRAYGIDVRGLQGISTLSEFGLRDRIDLVDMLVDRQVPALFTETSVSEKNIRAIVESCAAEGHTVRLGEPLFSDAMGDPATPEGTYVGMVRHNVRAITRALSAP